MINSMCFEQSHRRVPARDASAKSHIERRAGIRGTGLPDRQVAGERRDSQRASPS